MHLNSRGSVPVTRSALQPSITHRETERERERERERGRERERARDL